MNTMNTGAASLLPCPMCGAAPKLIVGYSPLNHAFVDCDCGMQTALKDTGEEVTAMWNRRSPTTQADAAPSDRKLEPWLYVEEVKQLCRDYSSRNGNVYIKDVESSLDGLANQPLRDTCNGGAIQVLAAIINAKDSGQDASLILDENSPLGDAARAAIDKPVSAEYRCRKCGDAAEIKFSYARTNDCCRKVPCERPGKGPCDMPARQSPSKSISDAMMDLVDRLGHEWEDVDQRAWSRLLIYAPSVEQDGDLQSYRINLSDGTDTLDECGGYYRDTDVHARMAELAMLVKKLVRHVRKASPDNNMATMAMDYLQRKGLAGSPLRSEPSVEQDERGAFDEIRSALDETYGFASTSPRAQENINFISEKLSEIEKARAASTSANVAQGWKLVPVEPTHEMKKAGTQYAECAVTVNAVFAYRAMLAAAPIAPSANVAQGAETIYQVRDDLRVWIDVDADGYERAQQEDRRIVYTAPPAQTALTDDARECLMDVVSHHHDFRTACIEIKAANETTRSDELYWQKQIDVLDRMYAQAERALTAAQSASGDTK